MHYQKLIIIACNDDSRTGEGSLFETFLGFIEIDCYDDVHHQNLSSVFSLSKPFGAILSYIWLWKLILFIRLTEKDARLAIVNYLPIWNFVTFALVPRNCILAPITGNGRVNLRLFQGSVFTKMKLFFLQNILLHCLSKLSAWIVQFRRLRVVGATPCVSKLFGEKDNTPLFIWSKVDKKLEILQKQAVKQEPEFDFIVYTGLHRLKNSELLKVCLRHLDSKGLKGVVIGHVKDVSNYRHVTFYDKVSKDELLSYLTSSRVVLQLSLEKAGFFAFEASLLGLPIVGFSNTGCANLPSFYPIRHREKAEIPELVSQLLFEHRNDRENTVKTEEVIKQTLELRKRAYEYYSRAFKRC